MRYCNPNCNYTISKDMSERISILRFILTIMVIYIHSYGSVSAFSADMTSYESANWLNNTKYIISQIITRAAVPGFFLISSILLYRKPFNWAQNIKRKLKSLAVPFFVVNIAWIILFLVLQAVPATAGIFNSPDNIIKDWDFRQWINGIFGLPDDVVPFLYPLWFLRDLLILNFFAAIIWWLVDKVPELMLLGALILWFFYSIPNCAVPDYQAVSFWIIGAYIIRRNINLRLLDKVPCILLLALIAFGIWKFMPFIYADVRLWHVNLCITLCLVFAFIFSGKITNSKSKSFLLKLSSYSFSIYLFHEFTTLLFRKIAVAIFPGSLISQFLQYMLIPFVVTAFCIVFSIVFKKLMPRFYTLLTGGR